MDGVAAAVTRRNIANRVVAAVSGSYARLQFITMGWAVRVRQVRIFGNR